MWYPIRLYLLYASGEIARRIKSIKPSTFIYRSHLWVRHEFPRVKGLSQKIRCYPCCRSARSTKGVEFFMDDRVRSAERGVSTEGLRYPIKFVFCSSFRWGPRPPGMGLVIQVITRAVSFLKYLARFGAPQKRRPWDCMAYYTYYLRVLSLIHI